MKLVKGAIAFGDGPAGAALDKLHYRERIARKRQWRKIAIGASH